MVIGTKQRALEKLAYRFWEKDKSRSAEDNWKLAVAYLKKLEERVKKCRKKK